MLGKMTVVVNKSELMEILTANRQQHEVDYMNAVEVYWEARVKELSEWLELAKENRRPEKHYSELTSAKSHISDYDRVIQMVQLHVEDTMELSQEEFARYVQDEWDWREVWDEMKTSNSSYLSSRR